MEVTFEEGRRHPGRQTQRQRSDQAIARTTPARLGLFSVVTLLAHPYFTTAQPLRRTAWDDKRLPTFVDALVLYQAALNLPYFEQERLGVWWDGTAAVRDGLGRGGYRGGAEGAVPE
jgi:hypothetical protein